ncbi:MAG: carbon-nitrogen hydrolase family protein [Fimbriimonas sp.]
MPKVACIQSDVDFGNPEANTSRLIAQLSELSAAGVELVIFPECYLTGYCVSSVEAAREIAIPRTHTCLKTIQAETDRLNVLCVVGFAEISNEQLLNTAVLFEPGQVPRFYEKTHLPELGFDKFVRKGESLPVFHTRIGMVGILICFDLRFPETVRELALQGADLIALPTNWPEGADVSADLVARVRALENKVFIATCNRVGSENGFKFIGKSKIINPMGVVMDEAQDTSKVLIAEIDFEESRNKRIVTKRGEYEITVFDARRPELYVEISKSN